MGHLDLMADEDQQRKQQQQQQRFLQHASQHQIRPQQYLQQHHSQVQHHPQHPHSQQQQYLQQQQEVYFYEQQQQHPHHSTVSHVHQPHHYQERVPECRQGFVAHRPEPPGAVAMQVQHEQLQETQRMFKRFDVREPSGRPDVRETHRTRSSIDLKMEQDQQVPELSHSGLHWPRYAQLIAAAQEKPRSKSETDKETLVLPIITSSPSEPGRVRLSPQTDRRRPLVSQSSVLTPPLTRSTVCEQQPEQPQPQPESPQEMDICLSVPKLTVEDTPPKPASPLKGNFKKALRARYLSEATEDEHSVSKEESDDRDEDVFEISDVKSREEARDKPHVSPDVKPGPRVAEQMEPLDLSSQLQLSDVQHQQPAPQIQEAQRNPRCSPIQMLMGWSNISEMTATSSVPISPRWQTPPHTHTIPPTTLHSHYLMPRGSSPSLSPSPGLSPHYSPSSSLSPGTSPSPLHYQMGTVDEVCRSPLIEPAASPASAPPQGAGQHSMFIFPPPVEMLTDQSTTDKSFACPMCSQPFPSYDNLAKHMAKHLPTETVRSVADNSKIHYCKVCNRAFSRSDMLTRHMRLHTGLKPYECRVCGQVFSRSDHLNTHARTHTGEKPYRCPQCPYAACRRDMITRHMRIHLKRWTKRSPFGSSSSEDSPRHWSSGDSTESSVVSDRHMSVSSMESTDLDPSPRTQSVSSFEGEPWAYEKSFEKSSVSEKSESTLSSTSRTWSVTSDDSCILVSGNDNNGNGGPFPVQYQQAQHTADPRLDTTDRLDASTDLAIKQFEQCSVRCSPPTTTC